MLEATAASDDPGPRCRIGLWLYVAHLASIVALAVSNNLLALGVLAMPWCAAEGGGLRAAMRERLGNAAAKRLLLPLGLFALVLVVSVAVSYEPRTSFRGLSDLFALSSLVLALFFVRSERSVRLLVTTVILLGLLLSLLGLGEYLFGTGGLDLQQRIRGPLSHYQTFAGVLLLCDLFLIATLACGGRSRRAWHWVALVPINVALLGSLTRGAWVGLAVAVTLLLFLRARRYLLAYVPAAILFLLLAPPTVRQRAVSIFDMSDTSNFDRLCMAYAGGLMIAERPLFGLGPELVASRYPIYRHPSAPQLQVPHLHNSFLQLAAEQGLLGLAAYLWLCTASLRIAVQALRREGGIGAPRAGLYLAGILALVAFNVAGVFEDNWSDREVQRVLLFAIALPACLAKESAGT